MPDGPPVDQPRLGAHALAVRFGAHSALAGVDLVVRPGAVTALCGPNGSGKTTLLRCLARLHQPEAGVVTLDGRAIAELPTRAIARRMAILPQGPEAPAGLSVEELVAHGRHPHRRWLAPLTDADRATIEEALGAVGLHALRQRAVDTLSGGERQRAWLAMALAQRPALLLLDEPTTYLDLRHQLEVLGLVRALNRARGLTVVWVLHDINHALGFSDHVVLLRQGNILAEGPPTAIATPDLLRAAFEVEVVVMPHPRGGAPLCVALPPER